MSRDTVQRGTNAIGQLEDACLENITTYSSTLKILQHFLHPYALDPIKSALPICRRPYSIREVCLQNINQA